jgi:hypothetical protein
MYVHIRYKPNPTLWRRGSVASHPPLEEKIKLVLRFRMCRGVNVPALTNRFEYVHVEQYYRKYI